MSSPVPTSTSTRPKDLEGSLSVLGSSGSVEIGGFAVNQIRDWHFDDARPDDEDVMARYSVNPPDVYGYGHQMYLEHVASCIQNGQKQLVGGREGRRSLELIRAIYEAAESGGKVKVHKH